MIDPAVGPATSLRLASAVEPEAGQGDRRTASLAALALLGVVAFSAGLLQGEGFEALRGARNYGDDALAEHEAWKNGSEWEVVPPDCGDWCQRQEFEPRPAGGLQACSRFGGDEEARLACMARAQLIVTARGYVHCKSPDGSDVAWGFCTREARPATPTQRCFCFNDSIVKNQSSALKVRRHPEAPLPITGHWDQDRG
jgi:hypothetical protein